MEPFSNPHFWHWDHDDSFGTCGHVRFTRNFLMHPNRDHSQRMHCS
jgi:hypothetical protein